ncbi:hypothetical protein ABIE33_006458 [Ensifer sp. 4252]
MSATFWRGRTTARCLRSEIGIEDLKGEKIISFSRQNLSHTERYFTEKFEEHYLAKSVAYTCGDFRIGLGVA